MAFADHIRKVLDVEGGLVDNPKDPGGLTNCGISLSAHPELTRSDIVNMTPARATEIYRTLYWAPIRGDELDKYWPRLSHLVLDMAVNSGVGWAAKVLQRALKLARPDGVIGISTLDAVRRWDPELLCRAYLGERLIYMSDLKVWPDFKDGWIRRVLSL